MSLQEKLAALKTEFETKMAPPAVVEALHRVTNELIASGQAERALRAGDRAPSFTLPDPDGQLVSSAELLAKGPLVVTFYRGAWCPFCSLDLQALEEARSEMEARGATLVAISPQTAPNSRKAQRTNKLGFPILGDQGGELAARFGIRWKLPKDLQEIHKQLGADLTAFNGDDSWTLPMPARYVIGEDGVIAYAEINPDYTRRPEPSDIYPVLDRLRRSNAASGPAFATTQIETAKLFYRAFTANQPDLLDQALAPDWQAVPLNPGQGPGREGFKPIIGGFNKTIAGIKITNDDFIESDDKLVVRSTIEGTQAGEFAGFPSKGQPFKIMAIDILQFKDGQIIKTWHIEDWLSGLFQMGAFQK